MQDEGYMSVEPTRTPLFSRLPKWLRIVLIVLSILTIVYWLGVVIYKILCGVRIFGEFIFNKRNYWTFLTCIAILLIGTLLVSQFALGLDPIGKAYQYILDQFNNLREIIGNKIRG